MLKRLKLLIQNSIYYLFQDSISDNKLFLHSWRIHNHGIQRSEINQVFLVVRLIEPKFHGIQSLASVQLLLIWYKYLIFFRILNHRGGVPACISILCGGQQSQVRMAILSYEITCSFSVVNCLLKSQFLIIICLVPRNDFY